MVAGRPWPCAFYYMRVVMFHAQPHTSLLLNLAAQREAGSTKNSWRTMAEVHCVGYGISALLALPFVLLCLVG